MEWEIPSPASSSNSWNPLGSSFLGGKLCFPMDFPLCPPFPPQPIWSESRGNFPRQIPAESAPWEGLNPKFGPDDSQLLISFCFSCGMSVFFSCGNWICKSPSLDFLLDLDFPGISLWKRETGIICWDSTWIWEMSDPGARNLLSLQTTSS